MLLTGAEIPEKPRSVFGPEMCMNTGIGHCRIKTEPACRYTISFRHLQPALVPGEITEFQKDGQKKPGSVFLRQRPASSFFRAFFRQPVVLPAFQFTAFLSGKHLHGFYIFFLKELLI